MSDSQKPRISLRVIDKSEIIEDNSFSIEALEKKKGKRGRPRKNPVENETEIEPELDVVATKIMQLKKRGRKKKKDTIYNLSNDQSNAQTSITSSVVAKNYIVQLKVKSSDLEKIQKLFVDKTTNIGYNPLIGCQSNGKNIENNFANINEQQKDTGINNFDEYYKLLNNLEMPLVNASQLMQHQMCMTNGHIIKNTLPEIPNIYPNISMPILPGNIPIRLFDESEVNDDQFDQFGKRTTDDNCKISRNTTNLTLPQFNNNGGKWPEKSPYACMNCDIFFDGTPIGIPDKELDGNFYCYGNFCDFSCGARYLKDRESSLDYWKKYSLLCIIYQKAYNLPPGTKVPLAPQRETLTKFGGKLSYDEYHQANKLKLNVEIYKLPLIPVLLHIEEISRSTNINNIIKNNAIKQLNSKIQPKNKKIVRFIPIDPQKLIKAEENLRIKTQERLQLSYTLDDCLHHK